MKKILFVLVLVLILSVGSFFVISQEKVNVLVQYLPAPISEFLNLKDNSSVIIEESISSASAYSKTDVAVVPTKSDSIPKQEESTIALNSLPDSLDKEEGGNPEVSNQEVLSVEEDTKKDISNKSSFIDDSPELMIIRKKLQKVKERIDDFDDTNANLKAKFDKIIKENRVLTLELKKINDKIKEVQPQSK